VNERQAVTTPIYDEASEFAKPQNDSWDVLAKGMDRMVKGRREMASAADKAVSLAAPKTPKHNPTPRGPAGKALSSRAMRRAMGETNRNKEVTLVGTTYFDNTVELAPSTRAPKRISAARKSTR
jgi:hypothetical protein